MFRLTELSLEANYCIANEPGNWTYEGRRGAKYRFWRLVHGSERKVSILLSERQVKQRL